jgi:hypothetical protein
VIATKALAGGRIRETDAILLLFYGEGSNHREEAFRYLQEQPPNVKHPLRLSNESLTLTTLGYDGSFLTGIPQLVFELSLPLRINVE